MNQAQRLRDMLATPEGLFRFAGAHNVLGARLAHQAGFDGVWASSFELATSHGVYDADVLTWQELLSAAGAMARGACVPVIADCQNGFGDAKVVRSIVDAYETRGVAAVCFEDGACPRRNSLLSGEHGLAPVEEFAGKIATAAQSRRNMLVLARVQALVARQGQSEALRRAHAYVAAGADAIVIHSRSSDPAEVLAFVSNWDRPTPLVLIPTTYHALTYRHMSAAGKIRLAIYANHGLRAAIASMQRVFRQILADGSAHEAEMWIATLDEAFELQTPPPEEATS